MQKIGREVNAVHFRVHLLISTLCELGSVLNALYTHSLLVFAGAHGIRPTSQMGTLRCRSLPKVTEVLKVSSDVTLNPLTLTPVYSYLYFPASFG